MPFLSPNQQRQRVEKNTQTIVEDHHYVARWTHQLLHFSVCQSFCFCLMCCVCFLWVFYTFIISVEFVAIGGQHWWASAPLAACHIVIILTVLTWYFGNKLCVMWKIWHLEHLDVFCRKFVPSLLQSFDGTVTESTQDGKHGVEVSSGAAVVCDNDNKWQSSSMLLLLILQQQILLIT